SPAVVFQFHYVGIYRSVFTPCASHPVGKTEPRRRCGTHQHGVVPGQFGERLRQLLKPPVVRKAAINDRRIWPINNFQRRGIFSRGTAARALWFGSLKARRRLWFYVARRKSAAGNE